MLVGGQGTGRGSLVTTEEFKDFELDLEFMLAEHGTQCSAQLVGPEQANASAKNPASTTAASASAPVTVEPGTA